MVTFQNNYCSIKIYHIVVSFLYQYLKIMVFDRNRSFCALGMESQLLFIMKKILSDDIINLRVDFPNVFID